MVLFRNLNDLYTETLHMTDEVSQESQDASPIALRNVKSPDFRTIYTNNAAFAISLFEFSITFGEISEVEETAQGRIGIVNQSLRVVMSHLHAKLLLIALAQQLQNYEQRFGEVVIPPGIQLMGSTAPVGKKQEPESTENAG
jgi:hypothetical protein